jgi:hypothetical protein
MKQTQCEEIKAELKVIKGSLQAVHDDVLVLKTQRDTSIKFFYIIAGAISLVVSLAIGFFRR